ncbi:MAG: thioesterase [Gemmatimonadales bacterium]|nr:MAG: thioesterase [Gemmatimonadales bacterium]
MTNPWTLSFERRPDAELRLYCFPHAGVGGSAYRSWSDRLPEWIELNAVQLPGRENRFRERPIRDMEALAESVTEGLTPSLDRPFAFFGHSMGALVAYEVARILEGRKGPRPRHLFVSGRRAPQLPRREPLMSHLPDESFVAEIGRRYGGIPHTLLAQPDLLALFLPSLRADMEALEAHTHRHGSLLSCPVRAYGGRADALARAAELEAWAESTTDRFGMRLFDGGHFYLQAALPALLGDLIAEMASHRFEPVSDRTAT